MASDAAAAATINNMGKQIKGGYLLRYKKGWLWRSWREEWVVLYEDSTLAWFKDKGTKCPRGHLQVNEAPELLAISEWTLQVPCRPRLPPDCHVGQLIAVGSRRRTGKVHWLLAQSQAEVNDWMTAINNTLPPPPHFTIETDKNQTVAILHDAPLRSHNKHFTQPRLTRLLSTTSSSSEGPPGGEQFHRGDAHRDDYASGTIMGGAALNWGHGWGWTHAFWGAHAACADLHHVTATALAAGGAGVNVSGASAGVGSGAATTGTTSSVYATEMSGHPYSHAAADDYGTGFEDYGMDCGVDFGF